MLLTGEKQAKKLRELSQAEKKARRELLDLIDQSIEAEISRIRTETELRLKMEKERCKRNE